MNTKDISRSGIIARLASLPRALQGKICEDRRTLADGTTAVYHNLQYWHGGKNHTIRIPADRLRDFQEAVENGRTARDLLADLTRADAEDILSDAAPLKKKSRKSPSRAPRRSAR